MYELYICVVLGIKSYLTFDATTICGYEAKKVTYIQNIHLVLQDDLNSTMLETDFLKYT